MCPYSSSYVKTTQWGPVFSGMWLGRGPGSLLPLSHVIVWAIPDCLGLFMPLSLSFFLLLLFALNSLSFSHVSFCVHAMNYDTSISVENLMTLSIVHDILINKCFVSSYLLCTCNDITIKYHSQLCNSKGILLSMSHHNTLFICTIYGINKH